MRPAVRCNGFQAIGKTTVMIRPAEPFIIDIEASGFGGGSYPIEIGVALDDGKKFCTLIMPAPGWTHWDADAESVHHIARKTLETCGKPVDQVARSLNQMLGGATLYSDGWVVDKPWLTTLFYMAGEPMQFEVSPLELILSEQQMEIWHETKEALLKESQLERHRASNDAWLIQQTFKQTLDAGFRGNSKHRDRSH